MTRLFGIAATALAIATSAQAMSPPPPRFISEIG
jgi:hypothetical protein